MSVGIIVFLFVDFLFSFFFFCF